MALIDPVVSSGSPLVTPGYPYALVPGSNPLANPKKEAASTPAPVGHEAAKAQSGHAAHDRVK